MEFIYELEDIASVAEIVWLKILKKVIFYGEMGAGKLLLSNNCKTLGVTEATSSPTFSLVNVPNY
jgi:tRNA threonylcarbamoyladenosine biosynthesis protein TsaE